MRIIIKYFFLFIVISNIQSQTVSTLTCGNLNNQNDEYSFNLEYTGGNGASYANQIISSSFLTGYNATISAGSLSSNSGSINLSVKPTATTGSGNSAIFNISFGGLNISCSYNLPSIQNVNCAGAYVDYQNPLEIKIPCSNGNGIDYAAGKIIPSTNNSGITAKRNSGTVYSGNSEITYVLSGVPNPVPTGKVDFPMTIAGKTCSVSLDLNNKCVAQNIACKGEYDVHKKAVAYVEWNGVYFTGAIVNNYNQDGKYFFLTSAHQLLNVGASVGITYPSMQFFWDRERNCGSSLPMPIHVTYGAKVVALESPSEGDLALLELSSQPPYKEVIFLGWKATTSSNGSVIVSSNNIGLSSNLQEHEKMVFDFTGGVAASGMFATPNYPQINNSLNSNQLKVTTFERGVVSTNRGHGGSPVLNPDFDVIGAVMGSQTNDCAIRGPNYIETLKNSKAQNSLVYQLLAGGANSTVTTVKGMKWIACIFNKEINNPTIISSILTSKAINNVISKSKIDPNLNVLYRAGNEVILENGFEAPGNLFEARIQPCDYEHKEELLKAAIVKNIQTSHDITVIESQNKNKEFFVYPTFIEFDNKITIEYYSQQTSKVEISLYGIDGNLIENIYTNNTNNISKETLQLKSDLPVGIYFLQLSNGFKHYTSKIFKQ